MISADDEDREETHSFYIQNINFESSSSLWVFGLDGVNSTDSSAGSGKMLSPSMAKIIWTMKTQSTLLTYL